MTYVITQNCCNDATCAQVCPVGCIHPAPGEPGYARAEMLYIDPDACIDCAACVDACPVDAVYARDELPSHLVDFAAINAGYFRANPTAHSPMPIPLTPIRKPESHPLRVAIVGAGPSGFYAAEHLLRTSPVPVRISLFDRLPTPFGLVRAGVAPDHPHTKSVTDLFRWTAADQDLTAYYNVEIGEHLSHAELLAHHHAVIYTTGAPHSRRLGIPGEDLPGSHSATEFVGWYNGHPDFAQLRPDLSGTRAVVIGNGNVALDVARILLCPLTSLSRSDIADHALSGLAGSEIEEVVLCGRRGPDDAAFTTPEIMAFAHLEGVEVVVDPADLRGSNAEGFAAELKRRALADLAATRSSGKRLVLRFFTSPAEIIGEGRVEGVRLVDTRDPEAGSATVMDTGLVIRSIGYRGKPLPELPFDEHTGTLPNDHGRVIDPQTRTPVPATYTAGWIKRGPSGVIGTNRADAAETVAALLEDFASHRLPPPTETATNLSSLLRQRQPDLVDRTRWQRIDEHEIRGGVESRRPRIKLTSSAAMLRVADSPG